MKNHQLLGRTVHLDTKNSWSPMWKEWSEFFGKVYEGTVDEKLCSGVVEAVHRDNSSMSDNPFYVLVRNRNGQTREFALRYLMIDPEGK